MKVICVDSVANCHYSNGKKAHGIPPVIIGSEYTVINKVSQNVLGKTWLFYELLEIRPSPFVNYYASDLFAELSDIDENELVNTKEEVYA